MPEIPDLEGYSSYFNKRLPGVAIVDAELPIAWMVRAGREELLDRVRGQVFRTVKRHGKLLMFALSRGRAEVPKEYLVVHAMLAGRYQYAPPEEQRKRMTAWVLKLDNGMELRYFDERRMGRTYLVRPDEFAEKVPRWTEMGPDVMDPSLDEEGFLQRVLNARAQIKTVITNERVVAGIGNAYADEVLWEARLHPFRRRPDIPQEHLRALFRAIRSVMEWATPIVIEAMEKHGLPAKMYRDHLRVHGRAGAECPRCGHRISSITSGGRETNFCRGCQE
jgi:formamidopyrimidine-DNA glycosylase